MKNPNSDSFLNRWREAIDSLGRDKEEASPPQDNGIVQNPEPLADPEAMLQHIKWLQHCLREAGYCIDGGKCHHRCDVEGDCWRQEGSCPLSGSHLTDDWKLPEKAQLDRNGGEGKLACQNTTNAQCRAIQEPSKSDIGARFVAEHGHRLAQLLNIDSYDIADRDAQIMSLLKEKK